MFLVVFSKWEMLMNVLRVMVNNPFKESFYGKKKINVLKAFSFPIKTVLKLS